MIYARMIVAMAAAVGLRLALASVMPLEALHVEVHAVGAYLAVIGALYGIIVAFLMFVVWEQFNASRRGSARRRRRSKTCAAWRRSWPRATPPAGSGSPSGATRRARSATRPPGS